MMLIYVNFYDEMRYIHKTDSNYDGSLKKQFERHRYELQPLPNKLAMPPSLSIIRTTYKYVRRSFPSW